MSIIKAVYYNKAVKVGTIKFDDEKQDPNKLDHKPTKWTTLEYNDVVIHNKPQRKKRKPLELALEAVEAAEENTDNTGE